MSGDQIIGVAIDAGSETTKAGFVGESFPRCVFPTLVARFRGHNLVEGYPQIFCGREAEKQRGISTLYRPVQDGLVKDFDGLEQLWHHTFYRELFVAPEETRVIHSVHPLVPKEHKEKMAEILFESFAIKGLYLAKSTVLSLHASGRTSGLVWECGARCAHACPVIEGFPLPHATVTSPLTGSAVSDVLIKMLADAGYSFTTPAEIDIVNNIKEKLCYVYVNKSEFTDVASNDETKICYTLPDGQCVMVGGERFKAPETMFQSSGANAQDLSVQNALATSVARTDEDCRQMLWSNVVIAGGGTMFPGFQERLSKELTLKLTELGEGSGTTVTVEGLKSRQTAAWVGASLLGSLPALHGCWITAAEYADLGTDSVHHKFF